MELNFNQKNGDMIIMIMMKKEEAKKLAQKYNKKGVIIFHFSGDGNFGYASFGHTKKFCGYMRRLADEWFQALRIGGKL